METTELKVTGMTCGMCVRHVTNALQNVAGVRLAAVDLNSGIATVKHEPQTKAAAMIEAVSEEGYEALIVR